MIFNLFKSKSSWQHKDSNVRIAAINEELSTDNNEDKAILLSLLNEDESELVRRAVLLKLNSFDEYFNTFNTNNNMAVQAFAATQVQDVLFGQHPLTLTDDQKQSFLKTVTNNQPVDSSLLNKWLDHEVSPTLVISLFEVLVQKKNAAQLFLQVFAKKQSVEIQKQLLAFELEALAEPALLSKLSKKAVNDDVMQLINDRLTKQVEQQEKPKRLLKQSQLILSKLLALKDNSDYNQYRSKKTGLLQEWQSNLAELSCLSEEEQQQLLTKYKKITEQLTHIFASKEENHQQAKIAEQLLNDKKTAKDDFNKTITNLNQAIITAVFEGLSSEDEKLAQQKFKNNITQLSQKLSSSVLNETEQAEFMQQIYQLEKRLTQLPEIAQSVSEATYLISKISQLALPQTLHELNERQQTYHDWSNDWKVVVKKACGVLPVSIKDAHKEISLLWRNGLKPLVQEQKQLFGQTKKKLIDLKRLLDNGKYKVCFGLFKGVSQAIHLLSSSQQQQLQREFDNVSEKMAEISDWEHYIATPRKQELLTEITDLITTPLDNPNEQADKVKQFRKTWNSLGHAEETLDKELNDQFNIACEQAFAPCRLFYAEQEKLREQHLVTRNKILEQVANLAETIKPTNIDNSAIDFKALNNKLTTLQQRWQQAGDVDREIYQKLLKQYKNSIEPIQKVINEFYDVNGQSKQALISKAEQQLAVEDIYQAIDQIKKLQHQWRDIGFAGSHQESKLWQQFRAINDKVFEKREQIKSKQKAELDGLAKDFNQMLTNIKADIIKADKADIDKNVLLNAKVQATQLLSQVLSHKPTLKSVASAIEIFIKQTAEQIEQVKVEEERKNWKSLFNLLESMSQEALDSSVEAILNKADYQQLNSFWQKRLKEQCLLTTPVNGDVRVEKTLELEILAQVDSPTELADQRMIVQVGLMQEQIKSGVSIDLSERFVDWLRLGRLEAADLILLERLKKIFIK